MIYSTSLICCDQANVRADVKTLVDLGLTDFHADFMDGQFVPRLGICPEVLKDLRSSFKNEITIGSHLMLQNPEKFIDIIAQYSDTIWIHRETLNPLKTIDYVKSKYPDIRMGLAYNPETDFDGILSFKQTGIDSILVMGINPGVLSSSKYAGLVYSRISYLKSKVPSTTQIFIDGAVNFDTIPQFEPFCDGVVCGSSTLLKDVPSDKCRRVDAIKANCERLKSL